MIEIKKDDEGTMVKYKVQSKKELFVECVSAVRAVYKAIAQDDKKLADKMYSMLVAFMIAEREAITSEYEGDVLINYDT